MTDSQKLDLILAELTGLKENGNSLKEEVTSLREDVTSLREDVNTLKEDVNTLKLETARMNGEINGLKNGQLLIRRDIKDMKNKLENTYQLALEAWGNSIENRELLTQ